VLVLVTVGLVLASLVLLVAGFVQNALGLIYVSMLCAGIAGLALVAFARLARRRAVALAGGGAVGGASTTAQTVIIAGKPHDPGPVARRSPDRDDAEEPEAEGAAAGAPPGAGEEAGDEDWGDEVVFPIEDYDDLRVNEILPLLPGLDPDELQEVRDREMAGKRRTTILTRIDNLAARRAAPAPPPAKKSPARKAPAVKKTTRPEA
jgi:hypothetical protein